MRPIICRHCCRKKVNRPRGLCWACYYTPGVLACYPSTSKFARRGVGHGHRRNAPLPAEPTAAPAGSPEKLAVLAARVARGETPWHPGDNPALCGSDAKNGHHAGVQTGTLPRVRVRKVLADDPSITGEAA